MGSATHMGNHRIAPQQPGYGWREPAGERESSIGRFEMATPEGRGAPERKGGIGGISVGGILVIIGIIVALFVSVILGIIIILIGLIAFGGFVRGRWY